MRLRSAAGRANTGSVSSRSTKRDAVHIVDGAFWLASFRGALLVFSLVAILRSSTAEHPTVNRTVTGSNPVASTILVVI